MKIKKFNIKSYFNCYLITNITEAATKKKIILRFTNQLKAGFIKTAMSNVQIFCLLVKSKKIEICTLNSVNARDQRRIYRLNETKSNQGLNPELD